MKDFHQNPVAVKMTVGNPGADAVSVLTPGEAPSVQLPSVAMPLALVIAAATVSEPPPEVMVNVTFTPATGMPAKSLTSTDGAVATALPAAAVWLFPTLIAIEPAPSTQTAGVGANRLVKLPSPIAPKLPDPQQYG